MVEFKTKQHYLDREYYIEVDDVIKKVVIIPEIALKSFETRCPYLYRIRSEDNCIIPFIFNEAQQLFHEIVEGEFKLSKEQIGVERGMFVVLKSRQVGATTYTGVRYLDTMLTLKECRVIVLAHVDVDTPLIFDKYDTAFDYLPDYIRLEDKAGKISDELLPFKPNVRSSSAYQLRFKDKTKSWLTVRTAGGGDNVGKGNTVNLTHFSESASYEYYEDVETSVLQMMSNPQAVKFVVSESTANGTSGIGEGFYITWIQAETGYRRYKNGEVKSYEGYIPVFIPWYKMKKYSKALIDGELVHIDDIDFGTPEAKKQFLDREKLLMEKYDVPLEGINWYRQNIKTNCKYKLSIAYRYYPTFPEDAFLASDNNFFNSAELLSLKQQYETKQRIDDYLVGTLNEHLEFIPSTYGELRIKEFPDEEYMNRYIISLDQSEGLENGDYTSMKVFDRLNQRYVAHWYGKMAEDKIAEEFMKLGYYYNEAYLIPESNRQTVVNIIKPDGIIPYTGQIYEYDIGRYGWNTNGATRKEMLDENYAFLRDNILGYGVLFDRDTVDQYMFFTRTVTRTGKVKYEANQGNPDDIVFSDCLCVVANNRYDEEIVRLNEDRTDISRFINAPISKKQRYNRFTELGNTTNRTEVSRVGGNRFSEVGYN